MTAQLAKKLSSIYRTRMFITVFITFCKWIHIFTLIYSKPLKAIKKTLILI